VRLFEDAASGLAIYFYWRTTIESLQNFLNQAKENVHVNQSILVLNNIFTKHRKMDHLFKTRGRGILMLRVLLNMPKEYGVPKESSGEHQIVLGETELVDQ
jgi:hypothetical protein